MGRLKWVKGLEYTLEALGELHKKGVDFEYTLIGEGEEYERLCFAAYQLGIRDKVSFKGKMSHSEVKKAMEQADIYLQYSLQEGFCNSVLEAQAMGLALHRLGCRRPAGKYLTWPHRLGSPQTTALTIG